MPDVYNKGKWVLLIFTVIFSSWGCNIINPQEQIPTYIHIDSFKFEGGRLHDIKCVTVYYNGDEIGTFDLPATVPVITSGTSGKLQLAPGILVNGRNERPIAYPFYKNHLSTLTSQAGKVVTIVPETGYFDSVKFYTISDFESGITKFSKWGGTTYIQTTSADSLKYEGTGSGIVILPSSADSSIDSTTTAFAIKAGIAFIEFDYKTTTPFAVGLQATLANVISTSPTFLAGILPNDRWQKFYLNATGFTSQYPADAYNMYIKAALQGQTNGRLLIDNIKLVTF